MDSRLEIGEWLDEPFAAMMAGYCYGMFWGMCIDGEGRILRGSSSSFLRSYFLGLFNVTGAAAYQFTYLQ